jgi:hypothetical protein
MSREQIVAYVIKSYDVIQDKAEEILKKEHLTQDDLYILNALEREASDLIRLLDTYSYEFGIGGKLIKDPVKNEYIVSYDY